MNTQEAIFSRRSIRKFKEKAISKEQIQLLLKAAMQAPSAVNKQPWHFVVLTERKLMSAVTEFHQHAQMLHQAAAAILVVADPELAHDEGYWQQDCAAATQNILLAAHDLGLGAVWLGIYPREQRIIGLRNILNIPNALIPFSLVALGYPNEQKEKVNRFTNEKIHYNLFQK